MTPLNVDIIIPVWNRPVETRNALVSLIAFSPGARLVLVDNGSDRETERLLEEFAEGLGDQALLLKTSRNQGFVKAVNRGLARGEAEFLVLVRNTSIVSDGWLEPMLEVARSRPDAGLIVPRLEPADTQRKPPQRPRLPVVTEVAQGSFATLLVRKELFERQGGFDETMDGGLWCLKDYSRRALRSGYVTIAAEGGVVSYSDEVPLGSLSRREETEHRSAALYRERWGSEEFFGVFFPAETEGEFARARLLVLLRGARMGHSFTVVAHHRLYRMLEGDGFTNLHRNIRVVSLPRFFADRELRKAVDRLRAEGAVVVAGSDGMPISSAADSQPFSWLAEAIACRERETYQQGGATGFFRDSSEPIPVE